MRTLFSRYWPALAVVFAALLGAGAAVGTPTGSGANFLRLGTGLSSNPFATGTPGLYSKNTDGKPRLVSEAGYEYIAGTATDIRSSAGAPSGISLGSCWMDSTDSYRMYCKESSGNIAQRPDLLSPGTIGCGGTPAAGCFTTLGATSTVTLSGAVTTSGSLILPQTTAPAQTAEGSIVWDTNDDLLTVGDGASRKTMVDLAGTQTLTNKTLTTPAISSPVLSGTSTGAGLIAKANGGTGVDNSSGIAQYSFFGGPSSGAGAAGFRTLVAGDIPFASPSAIGSGTPAAGTFTALAANTSLTIASAPTVATYYKTCTLTSAAAATPIGCLAAADVPAALSAKLGHWTAYVNGATGWGTVTSCVIEDTAGNDLVTIAVAALTGNTFINDSSANVTKEARYRLGTGGAVDQGLQISCNANGTGSDLVVVLMGTVQ